MAKRRKFPADPVTFAKELAGFFLYFGLRPKNYTRADTNAGNEESVRHMELVLQEMFQEFFGRLDS